MFSQELIQRAEAIVFGTHPILILGLASGLGDITEDDWQEYEKVYLVKRLASNISLTFAMFVLASEGML